MTNPKGAAFACVGDGIHQQGLTKREYFAALAMQGLCANSEVVALANEVGPLTSHKTARAAIANKAVAFADCLIAELSKESS